MMTKKRQSRLRRAKKAKGRIRRQKQPCLLVHRTSQHIYANVFGADGNIVTTVSTLTPSIREKISYGGNIAAAKVIGSEIAKSALKKGIKEVAFNRAGFKYHGRIKALADAAREGGLEF